MKYHVFIRITRESFNQKYAAERLATVALGLSVVFLNLKMSAFIKEGKSEYLRKKTTRRTGLREEPTKKVNPLLRQSSE